MLDLAAEVQATSRLGCQIRLTAEFDGLTVRVPAPASWADHGRRRPGPWPPARECRVVAAMSGGSTVRRGRRPPGRGRYDVVGVTLQLYDHGAAIGRKGACCARRDVHDARRRAPGHPALRARLRGPLPGGGRRRLRERLRRGSHADPACAATSGSSSVTCLRSPATSAPTRWRPATTASGPRPARAGAAPRGRRPRTRAISCSPRPRASSTFCAFPG